MKFALLYFSLLVVVVSCSKTKEAPEKALSINGIWHLHNVSGGFAGINEFYERGDIVWDFENDSLFVQNADSILTWGILLEDGSYYFGTDSLDNGLLYIDSILIGNANFDYSDFYISQQYLDGFLYHFKR